MVKSEDVRTLLYLKKSRKCLVHSNDICTGVQPIDTDLFKSPPGQASTLWKLNAGGKIGAVLSSVCKINSEGF